MTRLSPYFASRAAVVLLAVLLSLPLLVVLGHVMIPTEGVWQHLVSTVLGDYVRESLALMLGVAIGSLIIGVSTAWLTSMCQFPGRAWFEWALLLPMAMPAYIIAYTYTGMLDFAGPFQTWLRAMTGWGYGDYWFPSIRSLGGAIVMLTLVLYPYVYLLSRAAFLNQSLCVLDVSRTLGNSPSSTFYRIALPLARPAIIAGLSLVLMETLADYGTVSYFGINTFTTGIFRTWFGLGSAAAAAQLAALLMVFILVLLLLEKWSRKQAQYHHTSRRHQHLQRFKLNRKQALLAFVFCLSILTLGFLLPAYQLAVWSLGQLSQFADPAFLTLITNSLKLAAMTALFAMMLAMLMTYSQRLFPQRSILASVRLVSMGYAIPGAVVAVGVMIPFAWLDTKIDDFTTSYLGFSTGLLLSGTLVALIFAYLVRFLAVSIQTMESGLGQISRSMDDAGRSLGQTPFMMLRNIHMPMLKGSLLTALLLVFVDVLKELPATLILRPFNFNTLAVKTYELASDERLVEAAPSALAIVAAGILPVILLSYSITRTRQLKSDAP